MNITDILNNEEFSVAVIKELDAYGVKHKEKKNKKLRKNLCKKTIFSVHLDVLDLTDVILASGKVVQIPKLVADACDRILEQVETEGIFRKAGSYIRQKEIRIRLEAGESLGKSHHIIDVANVIKYFFRELPEPLIPLFIQETLVRSLLIGENYVDAILLTCLLLQPVAINTLSFFMQFLHTVSLNENRNKMSTENLAIIFTPSLMPFSNVTSQRFTNHVRIVCTLIENANRIGIIPKSMENKYEISKKNFVDQCSSGYNIRSTAPREITADSREAEILRKIKKRRSGSLNYMFHGLKKVVGSAMGSREFLDDTLDGSKAAIKLKNSHENINKDLEYIKASYKVNNKRKLCDPYVLSTKKNETKKFRSSSGDEDLVKTLSVNPVVTSMERRWSIVEPSCSKYKRNKSDLPEDFSRYQYSKNVCTGGTKDKSNDNSCIQVHKADYDNKEILATKRHISNDFYGSSNSVRQNLAVSPDLSGDKCVQTQYERTPTKLKKQQNAEQRVICSQSTRKIGALSYKSQDKMCWSDNSSWHIHSSNNAPKGKKLTSLLDVNKQMNPELFSKKNILTTATFNSSYNEIKSTPSLRQVSLKNEHLEVLWISGKDFFNNTQTKEATGKQIKVSVIPSDAGHIHNMEVNVDDDYTPILSPKSVPGNISNARTCLSNIKNPSVKYEYKLPYNNSIAASLPAIEEISGRPSIARLRTENAGMVLSKAKLFNGLGSASDKL